MTDYYDRLKGPLSWLTPFFFDYETLVTDEITLKNMTLRQYLQRAPVTALAACIGHEEPQVYMPDGGYMPPFAQPYDNRIIEVMRELATRQDMVWVAHNAAFDVRVAVDVEKCPWPKHVWCNMEGAMGSWPELPGGYSLHNVTETFCPPSCRKFPVDLKLLKHFRDMAERKPVKLDKVPEAFLEVLEEVLKSGGMKIDGALTFELLECALALYNKRDVVGMQHVYYQEVERVSAFEQRVALRTHQQRKFFFEIDQERLDTFVDAMANNADYAALQAQEYLSSDDLTEIFNSTGGNGIQSVRYQRLKRIVNEKLSTEEFTSTSKKKISPVQLARNPKVAQVLEQTAVVGKMISHKRRSQIFRGVDMVHMELGYARAHTGRFSSPGVGSGSKGLNIHNCVSGDTIILTKRGWSRITELRPEDEIWTGQAFSTFDSVKYEGDRQTYQLGMLRCTSEQPIIFGDKRKALHEMTDAEQTDAVLYGLCELVTGIVSLDRSFYEPIADALHKNADLPYLFRSTNKRQWLLLVARTALQSRVWREQPDAELYAWASRMTQILLESSGLVRHTAVAVEPVYDIIGVEYGGVYCASGVRAANCPKHQKEVAKPLRQIFRLPRHLCFVRGDFANLEFRVEGILTKAVNVIKMFDPANGGDINNDPYCTTWKFMTGLSITKKDPVRQVAKCLAKGTTVLTKRGPVPIEEVGRDDLVFDGTDWVSHSGVVDAGTKRTINIDGVWMTPDHPVAAKSGSWFHAYEARFMEDGLGSLLDAGAGAWLKPRRLADTSPLANFTTLENGQALFNLKRAGAEVRNLETYDILNAGPRRCFTVVSNNGRLVCHNSACLGLGFSMQVIGYAQVILKVLADKYSGVTEKILRDIIIANSWGMPPGDVVDRVIKNLGCSQIVAISSYHIHRTFNMAYPEFTQAAKWIVRAMGSIATCGEGAVARDEAKRLIDQMYLYQQDAPDRDMIGLEIDNDGISKHPVVRVRCGPYPATVCWREPYQRLLDFKGTQKKTQLSILKSTDMPKGFSPQLAIENVTQAASRNGVCEIVENLDRMGYPDCIHIHDEILLIVPREREAVLKARDAIIKAAGPTHGLAFGWALLIKPDEVTVTESLWEDEDDIKAPYTDKKGNLVGNDRWGKIERNEPTMFEGLL